MELHSAGMGWIKAYAAPVEAKGIATELRELLELGVGKTAAAATLAARLATIPRPDGVLLFGVCGAFPAEHLSGAARQLRVLDVCVVSDDVIADDGVEIPGRLLSLDELGLGSIGPWRMDETATDALAKRVGDPPKVHAATVSTGSGTDARSQATARRTGASIETMEGAAVALVCERFGVPLVQLRCVSNLTGDGSRATFRLEDSVSRLHAALRRVGEL